MTDLASLLRAQSALQTALGRPTACELTPAARVAAIRMNVLAALDELHEVLHEAHGWKEWSKAAPEVTPLFAEELADLLHFVLNLYLLAYPTDTYEATADKLAYAYLAKNATNHIRAASSYLG